MSFYNHSPNQGQRSNFGVTPRQSVQNRMPPTFSNNRLHPSQSNQQSSVYGRQSMVSGVPAVSSGQRLQPSAGYQGRQSQYGRSQVGRSSAVQPTQPSQPQIPGGADGVKYIPLNWEDLLGGKEGMKGLNVSMCPSGDPGNPNRQLKFSFGSPGHGDAPANPGEVPLKVVSFQPVADYPGKGGQPITLNSPQMRQPALPATQSSGYKPQQRQSQNQIPQNRQLQPLRSTAMMAGGPNNSMPGQPQMIMMPPVYYTPGKGIISAPPGMQAQNSCKGCPNCKGSTNSMSNIQKY